MWLATKWGFYSIVKKDDGFHVRARTRADLQRLLDQCDLPQSIEVWPAADYRFRIRLQGTEATSVMQKIFNALAGSVDYSNFKSKIATTSHQRDKLHAYASLWQDMYSHQAQKELS